MVFQAGERIADLVGAIPTKLEVWLVLFSCRRHRH